MYIIDIVKLNMYNLNNIVSIYIKQLNPFLLDA